MIPVTEDGPIVLMRNWRHALGCFCWKGVRGFVDAGEAPAEAALCELGEETGLICDAADLTALGFATLEASTIAWRAAVFVAKRCRPGGERDATEPGLGELHYFDRHGIVAMLHSFEIDDATMLVALYCRAHTTEAIRELTLAPGSGRVVTDDLERSTALCHGYPRP